jgi:hypothetical protein
VTPQAALNPEKAILFMKYALGSVDGAARCGAWGIVPAYRPYLESEQFLTQKSPVFGELEYCRFWAGQEKELSPIYFRPAGWGAIANMVQREMAPILRDEVSVEGGMLRIVEMATANFERTRCI